MQAARREAGGEQEFPEEVRGVRVCVSRCGGCYPGVQTDEDAEQVWGEDVLELGEVGVFGGRGVA